MRKGISILLAALLITGSIGQTTSVLALSQPFDYNQPREGTPAGEESIAIDEQHFPDEIFRTHIKGIADKDQDNRLSVEERNALTSVTAKAKSIRSIKGIELFPNITSVNFDVNSISQADFSQNKQLRSILIANNRLTNIKLPNEMENRSLEYLDVFSNELTSLDVTNLNVLRFLHADDNKLTTLDLSDNPLQDGFVAMHNRLTSIILPKNLKNYRWAEFLAEQQEIEGYKTYWYTDADQK